MSTHRGLIHSPEIGAATLKAQPQQQIARYRCAYCKRGLPDRWSISAHEVQCDAKAVVQRQQQFIRQRFVQRQAQLVAPEPGTVQRFERRS